MSARAAAIAYGMVAELCDRLDAAGVTACNAPSLDHALELVWPLAKRLAKLERTAESAGQSAGRARAAVLDSVTAELVARVVPQRPAAAVAPRPVRWKKFDASQWRVELVPNPAADRQRDREVA